jgi:hypothetical protein
MMTESDDDQLLARIAAVVHDGRPAYLDEATLALFDLPHLEAELLELTEAHGPVGVRASAAAIRFATGDGGSSGEVSGAMIGVTPIAGGVKVTTVPPLSGTAMVRMVRSGDGLAVALDETGAADLIVTEPFSIVIRTTDNHVIATDWITAP